MPTETITVPDARPAPFERAWLPAIVIAGIALRLLLFALSSGGWIDPDHYMANGARLATGDGSWFDRLVRSAEYPFAGAIFYLSPLYPVFLSLFAMLPGYPQTAAIGHCVVGALMAVGVYYICEGLASRRAGLVAAVLFALWPPGAFSARAFMQEQLYIPLLVLSFALLVRHAASDDRKVHLLTGVCFGLSALARAMVLYYIFVLPLLMIVAGWRLDALRRRMVPLLVGVAIMVVPYSAFISVKTGRPMLIENHAGFDMMRYGGTAEDTPTVSTGVGVLVRAALSRPAAFASEWFGYVRAMFKPFGARWIDAFGPFSSRGAAIAASVPRVAVDLLYLAVLGLAPVGLVLARRKGMALVLASWVGLVVVATALCGVGGARFRTPVDPILVVLAAIALSVGWRRARRLAVAAAIVGFAGVAIVSVDAARGWNIPVYGFTGSPDQGSITSTASADALFLPLPKTNVASVVFAGPSDGGMVRVRMWMRGALMTDRTFARGERPRLTWARFDYVRVQATDASSGQAVPFSLHFTR